MLQYFLNNLWRWKCGLPEDSWELSYNPDTLEKTEWSPEFEKLMRNRLIMGAIRYGRLGEENKKKYDRVDSIIKRINKYQQTHNLELLVDVANLCLLEFVEGDHPDIHFHGVDDGEHVI